MQTYRIVLRALRHRPGIALPALLLSLLVSPVAATELSGHASRLLLFGDSELPPPQGMLVRAVAAGDFDCDGAEDLAFGDPERGFGAGFLMGAVVVGFGNPLLGLRPGGREIHQDSAGIAGVAESNDRFGDALAVADFDADGCDDLVVGVPGEPVAGAQNAGAVQLLPGGLGGPDAARDLLLPTAGAAPNGPSANHRKGTAVAAVQRLTSASSLPMLAIGAPGHGLGAAFNAGGVSIRRSASSGGQLDAVVGFIDRDRSSFGRVGDFLGSRLASADFNGDGFGDLAASTRHIGGCAVFTGSFCVENRGNLQITYGASSAGGLSFEEIHQDSAGVAGSAVDASFWGETLAVGDFDGDGFDDLAVGAPLRDVGGVTNAGIVTVLFGGPAGLRAAAARSVELRLSRFNGLSAEAGDKFGFALAAADFDRDGDDDLAIGVPGRRIAFATEAGLVILVPPEALAGAATANARVLRLGSEGLPGAPGTRDRYGEHLATGDFNDDGVDDLAVVALDRRDNAGTVRGAVNLVFATADTSTSIIGITPSVGTPGQPYTVSVLARRTTALASGVVRIRGGVRVRVSDGSECTISPSPSTGTGSCTFIAGAPGTLSLSADYAGAIGFRPSASAARAYTVAATATALFADGFE